MIYRKTSQKIGEKSSKTATNGRPLCGNGVTVVLNHYDYFLTILLF